MKLSAVLDELRPVVGMTSLIAAPESVSFSQSTGDLAIAQSSLVRVVKLQQDSTSDAAYWGYVGQVSYWRTVVNLLRAAEVTGADDLPDIPLPSSGGMVMDSAWDLEKFGAAVARAAGLDPL